MHPINPQLGALEEALQRGIWSPASAHPILDNPLIGRSSVSGLTVFSAFLQTTPSQPQLLSLLEGAQCSLRGVFQALNTHSHASAVFVPVPAHFNFMFPF